MSDLADNIDPTLPLERVADIADPIARTSSALEAAALWKAKYEQLLEGVTKQTANGVRERQIIAILLGRVPAPMNDATRWRFSREELNAAPTRHLRLGELPDGGAFVEL